jgi:hypothetical protein
MKKLTESDIIKMMKEEYDHRINKFLSENDIDIMSNVPGDGLQKVIASGLKVKHKKSRLLYTVSSVGRQDTILMTPEGDDFIIDNSTLENDYEIA